MGVMKHHDQRQLGEERVFLSYTSTSLFTIKEQELKMGRNLEAGEILLTGSISLLYYRNRTTSPRVNQPTIDSTLPYQSLIKKIPYMFACSPVL